MTVEEIDNPTPQAEPGAGLDVVGPRLAAARREQKLEPGAVASRLHLSPQVVLALESGDQSALPAMTFVRGYIKSYARLLGLDEKQILALLPSTESSRPVPLKAVGMRRARRRQPIGKWLLWLLAGAASVILVVYGVPVVERLLTRAEHGVDNSALPLPLGDQELELELEPLVPEDAQATVAEEPAVAPESDDENGEAPPLEDEAVSPDTQASPEAPATENAAADASGPALVTLRFTEDSWVEMESRGRKLVVGIQSAGSERSVRAEPPVQLLLGNAPGVVLEYRGKPVDLKRYQRGKVAHLILED